MHADTHTAETRVWPAHLEATHMPGSLPMGGVIPMTPIFAFETPAAPLVLSDEASL